MIMSVYYLLYYDGNILLNRVVTSTKMSSRKDTLVGDTYCISHPPDITPDDFRAEVARSVMERYTSEGYSAKDIIFDSDTHISYRPRLRDDIRLQILLDKCHISPHNGKRKRHAYVGKNVISPPVENVRKDVRHLMEKEVSPPVEDVRHLMEKEVSPPVEDVRHLMEKEVSPPVEDVRHLMEKVLSPPKEVVRHPVEDVRYLMEKVLSPPVEDVHHPIEKALSSSIEDVHPPPTDEARYPLEIVPVINSRFQSAARLTMQTVTGSTTIDDIVEALAAGEKISEGAFKICLSYNGQSITDPKYRCKTIDQLREERVMRRLEDGDTIELVAFIKPIKS